MIRGTRARRGFVAALALAAVVGLVSCSSGDSLASKYQEGGNSGYIEGDHSTLTIVPEKRTDPVDYSGQTEDGSDVGSDDTIGGVTVVNFWYAGCPPCRAEAADLVENYEQFSAQGVNFVGVNTRDQAAQAQQFEEEFGIEYPSILDVAGDRGVQRAFAGEVPLNAVPTTLVLDTEGRVAHRVLGQLADASHLRTLIQETLAEQGSGE